MKSTTNDKKLIDFSPDQSRPQSGVIVPIEEEGTQKVWRFRKENARKKKKAGPTRKS